MGQSTKGEDLAEPIGDGERKMNMLVDYRKQLQTLARRRINADGKDLAC